MRGLNKVTLIGNIGGEVDFQTLNEGVNVAKFSLATTEVYKDKNGQTQTETEWHTVVLWRGLAELAKNYFHKGSLLFVEGKIKSRSYEDKENVKRYVTEIVADNIIMLDKKPVEDKNG